MTNKIFKVDEFSLKKELKVNLGKMKVVVRGVGGVAVVSNVDTCSLWNKRVKVNSISNVRDKKGVVVPKVHCNSRRCLSVLEVMLCY